MVTIIPVASGKGGTGKSVFAVNLAASLALKGKTVILIDLDLGGSNLHAFLDIDPRRPGLGHFINRQESSLQATLVETDISRLYFIPGDADFPGTANIHYFMKKKLIKAIGELAADYVIADLWSGSSYNTIDFFLMSPHGVIVTLPEPTGYHKRLHVCKDSALPVAAPFFSGKEQRAEGRYPVPAYGRGGKR